MGEHEHEYMPDETNSLAEWLAKQSPDLQCVRIKTGPCPACRHPLAIWTIARCLDAATALRILAKSAAIHAFVIIPDDDAGIARVHKVYPTEAVWEMTQPHQFARMIEGLLEHHQCP